MENVKFGRNSTEFRYEFSEDFTDLGGAQSLQLKH